MTISSSASTNSVMNVISGNRIMLWKKMASCFRGVTPGCIITEPFVGWPIRSSANAEAPQKAVKAPVAIPAASARIP